MSVNEAEATIAVDAAARKAHAEGRAAALKSLEQAGHAVPKMNDWDEETSFTKNLWREHVLPTVWAALEALPDRSRSLWLEGYYAHEVGIHEEACPYPLV